MGNAQMLRINECNDRLQLTNSIVRDIQSHVNLVDHAVTGLAKGIDVLQSTCKLLLRHNSASANQEHEAVFSSEGVGTLTLQNINECISNNKEVMIESVKKLFVCMKNIAENRIENLQESFNMLAVITYQGLYSEDITRFHWTADVLKQRLENQKEQIAQLKKLNLLQRKVIEGLQERERSYLEERELFTRNRETIQQEIVFRKISVATESSSVTSDSFTSSKEVTDYDDHSTQSKKLECNIRELDDKLLTDKSDFVKDERSAVQILNQCQALQELEKKNKHDIESLQNNKCKVEKLNSYSETQVLPNRKCTVQVLRRLRLKSTKNVVEEFYNKLHKEMASQNIELNLKRCKRSSEITERLPLLVVSDDCTATKEKVISDMAIDGIVATEMMAVIVFHQKAEEIVERGVKNNTTSIYLSRVFHLDHEGSLHNTEMNKQTINELVAFLKQIVAINTG